MGSTDTVHARHFGPNGDWAKIPDVRRLSRKRVVPVVGGFEYFRSLSARTAVTHKPSLIWSMRKYRAVQIQWFYLSPLYGKQ
jgi:hypothetical protein